MASLTLIPLHLLVGDEGGGDGDPEFKEKGMSGSQAHETGGHTDADFPGKYQPDAADRVAINNKTCIHGAMKMPAHPQEIMDRLDRRIRLPTNMSQIHTSILYPGSLLSCAMLKWVHEHA